MIKKNCKSRHVRQIGFGAIAVIALLINIVLFATGYISHYWLLAAALLAIGNATQYCWQRYYRDEDITMLSSIIYLLISLGIFYVVMQAALAG